MSSAVSVKVKHNGVMHDVTLDPSSPASAFKDAIYQKTGVPLDRQKVMIKGGMLKDDADMTKLSAKPGQTFMLLGTAGPLPSAPKMNITFIEDMDDSELAKATRTKAGLTNLGNTCYLNSTLQVLRAVPELQLALNNFAPGMGGVDGESNLTAALRELYKAMGSTTEAFPPLAFLSILRQVAPQFAEMAQSSQPGMGSGGYAQQDAEEVWVRILNALQASLGGLPASSAGGSNSVGNTKFVEQFMTGRITVKRSTAEAASEEPTYGEEPFSVLQCNISSSTNEMTSGILDSLNQQLEKHSDTLGRTAVYDEVRRVDRLPAYLTTHFVRFYWRRDINKKTKIMRKVKFPFDLDVTPFLSDTLKEKIAPAHAKILSVEKDRDERAKNRRKAKAQREKDVKSDAAKNADPASLGTATSGGIDAPVSSDPRATDQTEERMGNASSTNAVNAKSQPGQALSDEDERALRAKEDADVKASIHPDLAKDTGCNYSGLYELVGVVTHKGAAADAGHYISWVRKDLESDEEALQRITEKPDEQEWYKFDDDRVSTVSKDKIRALDGGGEDSVAYILLYRSKK
ncbi:cysteine proteinase [Ceraceosorus bombacis]|uniref:Ubiquitin carboxyl-terminal hydrolase n=1 Tax=Ceraceosorus bombacis TaxID=401625 RepID=A0A0P1BTN5_9BASI|nr:cysteine proteinase [Ceraceosorus bombacis]